jgi:hypothetical protein
MVPVVPAHNGGKAAGKRPAEADRLEIDLTETDPVRSKPLASCGRPGLSFIATLTDVCRRPGWMGSEENCRFGAQSSCAPSQRCVRPRRRTRRRFEHAIRRPVTPWIAVEGS